MPLAPSSAQALGELTSKRSSLRTISLTLNHFSYCAKEVLNSRADASIRVVW